MTDTHRRRTLQSMAIALGAAILPGCATQAPPPIAQGDTTAALDQLRLWLDEHAGRSPQINLSLALLDGDTIAFAGGYGHANPDSGLRASERTGYRAGSISKVFTAVAALKLAEQGRLDLDAPLAKVLPGFGMRSRRAQADAVTPRQILRHRAGLPSDWAQGMWSDAPEPFGRLVTHLQDEFLSTPPGQLYAYSNVGFSLLGAALEHITGEPFARWMQDQLLHPLQMRSSAFEIAAPSGPLAAVAFDAQGKAAHEPGLRDLPAGGLNTTVVDLLQLARLWFHQGRMAGRQILSPASIAAMQTPPHAPALADTANVGLGWHLLDEELDGVGPLLWHAGGTPHHHAQLMLLPQLKLAVAVMSSSVGAGRLAQDTALKALTLMAQARIGRDPTRPWRQGTDPAYPAVDLVSRPRALDGHYDTPMGLVRLHAQGQQVHASLGGQRLALVHQPDGYLQLRARLLGLIPIDLGPLGDLAFSQHDTVDGQTWLIARRRGRFMQAGTRLEPVPIPTAWKNRLGIYRYDGGDPFLAAQIQSVRVFEEDGLLQVELSAGTDSTRLALAPVNDQEALIRGKGRGRGETVHAGQDGVETLLRHAGMRFVRQGGAT
ncbi:MAG: hypothetical protein RL654_2365 [Pseudomonadota bacterium]|jgi:CubicO group peptidase (beta-lactamase class C family)